MSKRQPEFILTLWATTRWSYFRDWDWYRYGVPLHIGIGEAHIGVSHRGDGRPAKIIGNGVCYWYTKGTLRRNTEYDT